MFNKEVHIRYLEFYAVAKICTNEAKICVLCRRFASVPSVTLSLKHCQSKKSTYGDSDTFPLNEPDLQRVFGLRASPAIPDSLAIGVSSATQPSCQHQQPGSKLLDGFAVWVPSPTQPSCQHKQPGSKLLDSFAVWVSSPTQPSCQHQQPGSKLLDSLAVTVFSPTQPSC